MAVQRTLEPSSVRLVRVPDVAPPFDGEAQPAADAMPGFDVWTPRATLPGLVPHESALPGKALPGTAPSAGDGGRQDESWAAPFARLLAETLAGIRPMRQLAPWLTDRARVHVRRAIPVLRCGQRPRVLRVLVSWPADDVAELSVIVALGPRAKALAIRMEKLTARSGQPPRWRCTDIETG